MADEYLKEFVHESEEQITTLNNALLDLERDPSDEEAMERIFRTAHTLKSNSGAMGFEGASDLAHAIEDLLEEVRAGRVEATPELMDTVFAGVDELEAMLEEVESHGDPQRSPEEIVEQLREHVPAGEGIAPPSDTEIESILEDAAPDQSGYNLYHVRLSVTGDETINGPAVIDALDDAFELFRTEPSAEAAASDAYGGTIDALFGSVVEEDAVRDALDPVEAVDEAIVTEVTDRYSPAEDADETDGEDADAGGDVVDPEDADVDELLDSVDHFDDIDEMAEQIEDTTGFEDLGDAGTFDDLDVDVEDEFGIDDTETETAAEPDDEPAEPAPDDEPEDANETFQELKEEVDPVSFDELQDELEDLEFDEYADEEEVGFDELLDEDELEGDDELFGEASADDDPFGSAADDDDVDELLEETIEEDVDEGLADDSEEGVFGADEPGTDESDDEAFVSGDEDGIFDDIADEVEASEAELDASEVDAEADAASGDAEAEESPAEATAESEPAEAADSEPAEAAESEPAEAEQAPEIDDEAALDDAEAAESPTADAEAADVGFGTDDVDFDESTAKTFDDDEPAEGEESVEVGSGLEDDSFGEVEPTTAETTPESTDAEAVDGFGESEAPEGGTTFEEDANGVDASTFDDDPVGAGSGSVPEDDSFGDEQGSFDTPEDPGFGADDDEDDREEREIDLTDLGVPGSLLEESQQTEGEVQSIRVDVDRMDAMLNLIEGLVTSRARLRRALDEGQPRSVLDDELGDLEEVTSALQDTVMDVRLVPLDTIVNKLPRTVRDIARERDKQVDLEMTGTDVEIDRSVLNEINDPLVHLVRNAADHGIEAPAERTEADKPETGTIELRAERARDRVIIEVEDDGRGLDPDEIREEAIEEGVVTEDEADAMSEEEVYELVFHSGLSTRDEVTDISGRGVGMDVVANTVEDLDGEVHIESTLGEGTTVRLELPVTLAIAEVLFVEVGDEEYGIPIKYVEQIGPEMGVETQDGQEVLVSDGGETESNDDGTDDDGTGDNDADETAGDGTEDEDADPDETTDDSGDEMDDDADETADDGEEADEMPEDDGTEPDSDESSDQPRRLIRLDEALDTPGESAANGMLVHVRDDVRPIALRCDTVRGQQEVVVKPFEGVLEDIPGLSGATVLGDGDVVNILDVETI